MPAYFYNGTAWKEIQVLRQANTIYGGGVAWRKVKTASIYTATGWRVFHSNLGVMTVGYKEVPTSNPSIPEKHWGFILNDIGVMVSGGYVGAVQIRNLTYVSSPGLFLSGIYIALGANLGPDSMTELSLQQGNGAVVKTPIFTSGPNQNAIHSPWDGVATWWQVFLVDPVWTVGQNYDFEVVLA